MTTFLVYNTASGQALSVGTVLANPLPNGLTSLQISDPDAAALQTGAKRWNVTTHLVEATPGYVDPSVSAGNKTTAQTNGLQALIDLQAIIDTADIPAGTLTLVQLSTFMRAAQVQMRTLARIQRGLIRFALEKFDDGAT